MSRNHDRIKNDPRWKAARAECLERDGYACVRCQAVEELEADHIVPLEVDLSLAFEVDNLRTLCRPCHTDRHREEDLGLDVVRNAWVSPRYLELEAVVFRA